MKRLLFLFLLCVPVQAANEIRSFTNCSAAFAVVRETDGDVWYVAGQVFEAWGTGGRTAADYDIALTAETGGMFTGTFDTNISAGYYYVVTHDDADSSPTDTDPAVWQDYGYWDGSSSWVPATVKLTAGSSWDELMADHTGEATFGGEVQQLDPNVTAILADTNELQTDHADGGRLDVIWDAIKLYTDLLPLVATDVNEPNDANNFSVTDGKASDDAFTGCWVTVTDADDSNREMRLITQWNDSLEIDVDFPFSFTPAANDVVYIWSGYLSDMYDQLQRYNQVVNVVDNTSSSSGGSAAQGTTTFNSRGQDP